MTKKFYNKHNRKIIVLCGPTATGKTSLGIKIAKSLSDICKIEIVNFDSLLFYKQLNIGTAKPTIEERREVSHHLIDIADIDSPINASDFSKLASKIIEQMISRNIVPLLSGGSGFYLKALVDGMYSEGETDQSVRTLVEQKYKSYGILPLYEELQASDPESATQIHINDHYRVKRALEYYLSNGKKFSDAKEELESKKKIFKEKRGWDFFTIYLDIEKQEHLNIINHRTRKMIENGLVDEVKKLLENKFSGNEKPLKSIGYKETHQFLKKEIPDKEALIERINISTRQLAKAQRTWFASEEINKHINPLLEEEEKEALESLQKFLLG